MQAVELTTEYKENPLGIDALRPILNWKAQSNYHPVTQKAYQICAASSKQDLDSGCYDLWDSGQVISSESIGITYQGAELSSQQYCFWKVRLWDNKNDKSGPWSTTGYWSLGLVSKEDWKAAWICLPRETGLEHIPPRYLRTEFTIEKSVKHALLYSTALGVYEMHVNGSRINDLFAPGWTDYAKRVQYWTHDVTESLSKGKNVLSLLLGSGWYAGHIGMTGTCWYGETPKALVQLCLVYDDGTSSIVCSDDTWKAAAGAVIYSDMIKGELYDAGKEHHGWTEPGFDDSKWSKVTVCNPYEGQLVAAVEPPITVNMKLKPVSLRQTPTGSWIYDMGQNMVGWAAVNMYGPSGTTVTVKYAEMLNEDGTLYTANLREARQEDTVIMGEQQEFLYKPHFTFHGFRYIELSGFQTSPDISTITGEVIHSNIPRRGEIQTSDRLINRLYDNIVWGQRGNFLSIPTDCPQRDERLGWTGDAQIFMRTASYNMDVAAFMRKYLQDIIDAQRPSGAFPDVAPDGGWDWYKTTKKKILWLAPDNAGWGDAGVIIPWTMHLIYKDTVSLNRMYPHIQEWIAYLKEGADEHLIRPNYGDYGDWLSINSYTPNEVVQTAYFAYSTKLTSQIADVLDKPEDAQYYRSLYQRICFAFQKRFVDIEGRIEGNSQTAYILALRFELLTEIQTKQALHHLTEDIKRLDYHLSTGFLGVGHVLPVLSQYRYDDIAYKLLHQNTFPSWLYSIKHGATTIWERWDGWTEHGGFQNPETNSFNHYALGSVGEWMYRYMLGIDTDATQPAYKKILIRPRIGGNLNYVNGYFETLYGRISTSWEVSGTKRNLSVTIPANTSARVYVPTHEHIHTTAGEGVVYEGTTKYGETIFNIGSGSYIFTWQL